jgi:hypothetical protein
VEELDLPALFASKKFGGAAREAKSDNLIWETLNGERKLEQIRIFVCKPDAAMKDESQLKADDRSGVGLPLFLINGILLLFLAPNYDVDSTLMFHRQSLLSSSLRLEIPIECLSGRWVGLDEYRTDDDSVVNWMCNVTGHTFASAGAGGRRGGGSPTIHSRRVHRGAVGRFARLGHRRREAGAFARSGSRPFQSCQLHGLFLLPHVLWQNV